MRVKYNDEMIELADKAALHEFMCQQHIDPKVAYEHLWIVNRRIVVPPYALVLQDGDDIQILPILAGG